MIIALFAVASTLIVSCNSFFSPTTSGVRLSTARFEFKPVPNFGAIGQALSVDDIALRWKVSKFGQGPSSYNGIELLDRTLEDQVITIPMSRVGGLGLDLNEYNVGKLDVGLILIEGIHIYMYIYIYIYIYIYTYVYIHMHTCIHMNSCIYIYIYMYVRYQTRR
jgi:hypothetical protein